MKPNRIVTAGTLSDGQDGTDETIEIMTAAAHHDVLRPIVRRYAGGLIPGGWTFQPKTPTRDLLTGLYNFLADNVRFVADEPGKEQVRRPQRMLQDLEASGQAIGDCDDRATLGVCLLTAMGLPAYFVVIKSRPGVPWHHVFYASELDGEIVPFDPQAKIPPFQWPPFADRLVYPTPEERFRDAAKFGWTRKH